MIPALIVPTLVHYDLLQNMLDSIDAPVETVIVIDNGGALNSVRCDAANNIHIVSLPINIGVASSWNLGIKVTPFAEWWLIANDDIIWNRGSLKRISEAIQPLSIVAGWATLSAFSGFAIDRQTIEIVGLFDEFYFPGSGEEMNYWRRANKNNVSGIHLNDLFSLQGGIGQTRKYLDETYPGMGARIIENLSQAIENGDNIVGWSLKNRRTFPF